MSSARSSAILLVSCVLLLGAGCGQHGAPAAEDAAAADGAAPPAAAGNGASVAAVAAQSAGDPLAGQWWVFLPDRPYLAFRLSLEPAQGDTVEGSWTSFDWLATRKADDLRRRSKGVRVTGEVDGDELRLEAPAPMLDANGNPNGHRGTWRLELHGSNLPGEPRRYAGLATCTEPGAAAGVPVSLERDFRPWKP